jgi:hypothetical protein
MFPDVGSFFACQKGIIIFLLGMLSDGILPDIYANYDYERRRRKNKNGE